MRIGLERIRNRGPQTNGRPPRTAPTSLRERLGARIGYRARTIGLSVVLALAAGLLTLSYVRRAERNAAASVANVGVFVAARDIPAGTPGTTILGRRLLARTRVPRRSVVPGAISSRAQVQRFVTAEPIYAGEQITTRRFRPLAEQGVRGMLNGTTRAIVVPGDANQLLAGILRRGDRVDVLGAIPLAGARGRSVPASRVVLRDLLVLRAAAEGEEGRSARRGSSSVVLALTDAQAQKLFFVMRNGQWALLLRPFGRSADSRVGIETARSVLEAGG
jgi:pilus assembly protein CpaB